ncbi:MAG: energy transducer TonB [Bacteroidota bacterium]
MFAQIKLVLVVLFSLLMVAGNYLPELKAIMMELNSSTAMVAQNSALSGKKEFLDQDALPTNLEEVKAELGYPKAAKDAGIQGSVTLKIYVSQDGEYFSHEVVNSFHPLLRIPTEAFAPYLTFEPAKKNGKSVSSWTDVTFEFSLNN